jgi:hypothetical protein
MSFSEVSRTRRAAFRVFVPIGGGNAPGEKGTKRNFSTVNGTTRRADSVAARRIPPNRRSTTGHFPSVKNGRLVAHESALERDNFYHLEFDDDVLSYKAQEAFLFTRAGGRQYEGFLDLEVFFRPDAGRPDEVHDVKYRDELRHDWGKLRPRLKGACIHARGLGRIYRLRTDDDIFTSFLPQAKFLYNYLVRALPDPGRAATFHEAVTAAGRATIGRVLSDCFADEMQRATALPTLWYMIASKQFGIDINSRLTMNSEIWEGSWDATTRHKPRRRR